MKLEFRHALALVPAVFLIATVWSNSTNPDWWSNPSNVEFALVTLGSSFFVLSIGHLTVAKTWQSHLVLIFSSLILGYAVTVASFFVRWFFAGWAGILFFTVLLTCLAGTCLALAMDYNDRGIASKKAGN